MTHMQMYDRKNPKLAENLVFGEAGSGKLAFEIMETVAQLKEAGYTNDEISKALNDAGQSLPENKEWIKKLLNEIKGRLKADNENE